MIPGLRLLNRSPPALHYLAAGAALPSFDSTGQAVRLCVVLATDHARLALLPWSKALVRQAHWVNYATSRFEQLYGPPVDAWSVRVIDEPPPRPRLAIALPTALLAALGVGRARTVPRAAAVRVELLDRLSDLLDRQRVANGVLVEIGRTFATVAVLRAGVLVGVRRRRIDAAASEESVQMLAARLAPTIAAEQTASALSQAPVWIAARSVAFAAAAAAALRDAGMPAELSPC